MKPFKGLGLKFFASLSHMKPDLRPKHGPQVWEWWRLFWLGWYPLTHVIPPNVGRRLWVYTRWGAPFFDVVVIMSETVRTRLERAGLRVTAVLGLLLIPFAVLMDLGEALWDGWREVSYALRRNIIPDTREAFASLMYALKYGERRQ